MSTLSQRQKLLAILPFLLVVFLFTAHPLHAQYVTTTVPVGWYPEAVAVNPVTNKIYVANYGYIGTESVTVIDGANDTTITVRFPAGTSPCAVAVDTMTNKIYVANCGGTTVTVIDGVTNSTTTVSAGSNPAAVAVNPVTNKIYVANKGSNNVTVIDGATNATTTVSAGTSPAAVAVNPATNQIYVANNASNNVTVIDGATNGTTTVGAGTGPSAVAVNPVTNKIYVANLHSGNVTVIDGATNATTAVSVAGIYPWKVAVNPVTNKIYVAKPYTGGGVAVIDGATNSTTTVTDPNASNAYALAVNPVTNKVYVANEQSNNVSVIDGATNATTTVSAGQVNAQYGVAVDPLTNKIYVANWFTNDVTVIDGATNSTITVTDPSANLPYAVAVNPITNKIYVANGNSNNVTVIDGPTNVTTTVGVGTGPYAIAVNPVTNKIYVANCGSMCGRISGSVTVIDGATNVTTTVGVGTTPYAIAVNPVTNKIYVANYDSSSVTVIDGATNSTTTVPAGAAPCDVAVNPVTNKIYVANRNSSNVTVIDGATHVTTTVGVGTSPYAIAVNPVTNKIYVPNYDSSNVTVIDGATNSAITVTDPKASHSYAVAVNSVTNKIYVANYWSLNVTVIDGATDSITSVAASPSGGPIAAAVNPVSNKIYVANAGDPIVAVIDEAQVQPIPLVTAITPLTGNQTAIPTPTFNFTATSSFSPTAPTPQAVWYQVDTWQGPWRPASGTAPNFSGTTPTLSWGTHILYAFATDGQDANSTGMEQQLIGSMAAYLFDVALPFTTTTLASSPNPSKYGQAVTFTATVTVNTPFSGTPTGTASFYANGGLLGSATLGANGQAVYTTSTLSGGSTSISAVYSGDASFQGSTSAVLIQQVNNYPAVTLLPTSLGFANQIVNTTSGTKRVTLTNSGLATMGISSIAASSTFTVASTTCGATLAVGAHCTVYVTFTPPVLGKLTGTLAFTDNAPGSPQTVTLSGVGVGPAMLSPATNGYPAQAVGTTSLPKIFTLINYQTVALNNIVISRTGDFAASSTACTTTLAPKSKCTINVTFTPTATGKRTGQLSVSDDASNSPQTSALTGEGLLPVTLNPSNWGYYWQPVGTTSAPKTFTLTNNESVTLGSIAISTTGDFAVSSTTCTTSLAAKSKCTIDVTFTPTVKGPRKGQLSVSDDAGNSPQTSNLGGYGS